MTRFAIGAAVAALSLSFALGVLPAAAVPSAVPNNTDTFSGPGVNDLGIDITTAGDTHGQVRHFLASMNPEGRRSVLAACGNILRGSDEQAADTTVQFCRLAL